MLLRVFAAPTLLLLLSSLAWAEGSAIKSDGEFVIKDPANPNGKPLPDTPDTTGEFGQGGMFLSSTPPAYVKTTNLVYERRLGSWTDPLTLPHSRAVCVKWAKGNWPWGGSWKTCVGWKTQFQFMQVTLNLRVSVEYPDITLESIRNASNECLATGAVAAALSAYYSGGTAASGAFVETYRICMEVHFTNATIRVETPTSARWGNWT
ncbi:hypothetical protein NKH69_19780 [Mesorhizobium sp. M0976]|uniref:hypothetical protein n=1 Tax=unclassified Mesorhizobium TaxID=325217 RepID=UPI0033357EF5